MVSSSGILVKSTSSFQCNYMYHVGTYNLTIAEDCNTFADTLSNGLELFPKDKCFYAYPHNERTIVT